MEEKLNNLPDPFNNLIHVTLSESTKVGNIQEHFVQGWVGISRETNSEIQEIIETFKQKDTKLHALLICI